MKAPTRKPSIKKPYSSRAFDVGMNEKRLEKGDQSRTRGTKKSGQHLGIAKLTHRPTGVESNHGVPGNLEWKPY